MRKSNDRRRMFERLESRNMMAGDVTVAVINGELIVTGDGLDNWIRFTNPANPEIEGRDSPNGVPTSINGVPNGSFTYEGLVTGDVRISMGGGNDRVDLAGEFPAAFTALGEAGDDNINGGSFGFRTDGLMTVDAGVGNDIIRLLARTFRVGGGPGLFAQSIILRGGDGNDTVDLAEIHATNDVVIESGAGADRLGWSFGRVGGFLGVDMGADYDEINGIHQVNATVGSFRMGTGTAFFLLSACNFSGDFAIFTDEGADFVQISTTRVMGTSYVITGGGGDYVQLNQSRFAQLQWNTGGGSDFVDFRASIADEIFATLSEDSDWLNFYYSVVSRGSVIGGNGFDLLTREGSMLGTLGTDFEQVS
jgi:hypothetical protein